MELHPIGSRENPAKVYDLLSALKAAKQMERKIWAKLRGETGHLYEVWPGGRNICWPLETLYTREARAAQKKARP
jgi:hypothetical protein